MRDEFEDTRKSMTMAQKCTEVNPLLQFLGLSGEGIRKLSLNSQLKRVVFSADGGMLLQALANVYKTRIDAVVSKAELEKLKLEKFGMQVNVYRAQIDANNAEWGGYKAALDGNGSLVNLYIGQVQAFGVEMSGFRTEVDAKAKVIETRAAANKALLEQHDSALRTYETIVRTQGEVARMHTEVDKTKISAWSAEVQARLGYATANADVYRMRANVAIHNATSRMQAQDLQQKSMLSFQTAVVNLANTNADVYGRMANAALSGMNSVVSKGE